MLKKSCTLFIVCLLVFQHQSCQSDKVQKSVPIPSEPEIKESPSVCIWEGASVRQEPTRQGKWITSIALGEKVTWLGITAVDSSDDNREYYKIRLSDETVGWSSKYVIATNAKPAVVMKKAPIYRRPDIVTFTTNEFDRFEAVAIVEAENNWIRVIGAENKKKGWIEQNTVSLQEADVAVGVLVTRALKEKDPDKRREMIESILNNASFSHSIFIDELYELVKKNIDS
jgi:hypothetical protein